MYVGGGIMDVSYPQLRKAQTTIEYLLIISVIVLLLISLFLTMRQLQESTQGNVTVNNQSQTPLHALNETLGGLRNSTSQNASS